MGLVSVVEFLKRIVAEIKYQIIYYALGGIAQIEDFIYAKCNKFGKLSSSIFKFSAIISQAICLLIESYSSRVLINV